MARVKPEQTVYIYGLRAKSDGLVMYVGCSVNPEKRLREHLSDALLSARRGYHLRPVLSWIVSRIEGGDSVAFVVLDTCKASEGPEYETAWIDRARAINPGLLNTERRSPYCSHVDDIARMSKQRVEAGVGDIVTHTLKVYVAGIWKYETRTCKVLRIGWNNMLVGGDINGVYTERWISPFSLRRQEAP